MSRVAQKEDLSDPDVIHAFAKRVGNERYLRALYLLTVADIRGTSPKVWNAWKGKLLEDLYKSTLRVLGGRAPDANAEVEARKREALIELARQAQPHEGHKAFWDTLDLSYFMRHDANDIAWHARQLSRVVAQVGGAQPQTTVRARLSPVGEGLQVLVVNPAVVLGKLAYVRSSGALYQVVLNGTPFFPAGNLNYIDVRDVAAITRALVEKNAWGERFVLSKESIPYQQFFQQAAQAFGGSVPKKSLSNGLISWGFPILKMLARVVGKNLPMTASVARNAQRKTRYSNQKVERYLQFRYRELQDTLNWAKTQE